MSKKAKQDKPRPIISGIILIGLGLFLLLTSHGYLEPEQGWPLLIIVVGAAVIATAFRRSKNKTAAGEPPWQGTPPPPRHTPPPPRHTPQPPRPGPSESGS